MWKVKRMNTAGIVVLAITVGAGSVAACHADGSEGGPPPAEPVARMQTVETDNTFIRRNERPDATTVIAGWIAAEPTVTDGSGFISPVGWRGAATSMWSIAALLAGHDAEVTKMT